PTPCPPADTANFRRICMLCRLRLAKARISSCYYETAFVLLARSALISVREVPGCAGPLQKVRNQEKRFSVGVTILKGERAISPETVTTSLVSNPMHANPTRGDDRSRRKHTRVDRRHSGRHHTRNHIHPNRKPTLV